MAHCITLWTNDPLRAGWADRAGIDRIGLDLEIHGKTDRQKGLPTWISPHRLDDMYLLKPVIRHAALFVRCNPLNPGSSAEIEALIAHGVDIIMLPNFTVAAEVEAFLYLVDGRATVVPLVERVAAVEAIPVLAGLGITEIHVGLNDLSIDLGEPNRLAVLATPVMDRIASLAHKSGVKLAVGGLGRAHDTQLPVPSDIVYAQQIRLGSTGALLARSFFAPDMTEEGFAREVAVLRSRLLDWERMPPAEIEAARNHLARLAEAVC